MKLRRLRSPFWSLFAVALILGLPFAGSAAGPARGGGGGGHPAAVSHAPVSHGGGFSGGSFRAAAPRAAVAPRGGAVAKGPRGGTAARGPYGGAVARGPGGQTAYRPGHYPGGAYYGGGGWDAYYGPEYGGGGGLAAAIIAALAIGTILEALPSGAVPQVLGGQTYYYDGSNYYQACYQGTDLDYCVVPNPNQ